MKTLKITIALMALCFTIACKADTNKIAVKQFQISKSETKKQQYIKVALLLDTSNSMDGLIDQAKAQLWKIVNELSYAKCKNEQPKLEIALYQYGNDKLSSKNGYVQKMLGFTSDLDEISKELFALTTNGGSEYCGTVISASLAELDWGNDADDLKMIFIAGNEPFTQGDIDYKDAAFQAKEKDVVVNTIFCGNFKHGVDTKWKDGAQLTYGVYSSIDHYKKTVHIASPYDDLILQLNIKLNNTYIPYGRQGRSKIALQQEQDSNAEGLSRENAVSRTISKSSHLYENSTWDLVDAEKNNKVEISELKDNELPEELKGMSSNEIKNYIAKKRRTRNEIQLQIAELNHRRQNYINEQQTDNGTTLESSMIKALRKQAEKKNYSWK